MHSDTLCLDWSVSSIYEVCMYVCMYVFLFIYIKCLYLRERERGGAEREGKEDLKQALC